MALYFMEENGEVVLESKKWLNKQSAIGDPGDPAKSLPKFPEPPARDKNPKDSQKTPIYYQECNFLGFIVKFLQLFWKRPRPSSHKSSYTEIDYLSKEIFYRNLDRNENILANFISYERTHKIQLNINKGFAKDSYVHESSELWSNFDDSRRTQEKFNRKYILCEQIPDINGALLHSQREKNGISFFVQRFTENDEAEGSDGGLQASHRLYYWKDTHCRLRDGSYKNAEGAKSSNDDLIIFETAANFNFNKYEIRGNKIFELRRTMHAEDFMNVTNLNPKTPKLDRNRKIPIRRLKKNDNSDGAKVKETTVEFGFVKDHRDGLTRLTGKLKAIFLSTKFQEDGTKVIMSFQNMDGFPEHAGRKTTKDMTQFDWQQKEK
jgi:hypothetical protein